MEEHLDISQYGPKRNFILSRSEERAHDPSLVNGAFCSPGLIFKYGPIIQVNQQTLNLGFVRIPLSAGIAVYKGSPLWRTCLKIKMKAAWSRTELRLGRNQVLKVLASPSKPLCLFTDLYLHEPKPFFWALLAISIYWVYTLIQWGASKGPQNKARSGHSSLAIGYRPPVKTLSCILIRQGCIIQP